MNNKGQAAIEYILLLVVVVALFLFTFNRLFNPFKEYFVSAGDYVQCLLEYGELPDLGSDTGNAQNGESANGKSCKAKFALGDANSNQSNSNGNQNGKGSSDGENGKDSKDKDKDSAAAKNKAEKDPNANRNSAGSGGGGAVPNNSFSLNQRKIKSARQGADAKSQELIVDNGISASDRNYMSGNYRSRMRQDKVRAIGISGEISSENRENKSVALTSKNSNVSEEDFVQPKKKMIVKPPENREIASEEEESWSFAGYIRILFIIAIAIIIFVLIGGQALQMSKSWEK